MLVDQARRASKHSRRCTSFTRRICTLTACANPPSRGAISSPTARNGCSSPASKPLRLGPSLASSSMATTCAIPPPRALAPSASIAPTPTLTLWLNRRTNAFPSTSCSSTFPTTSRTPPPRPLSAPGPTEASTSETEEAARATV
eukprot:2006367-Rhodomonas_salina.1